VASLCPLNATLALAACLLWSPGARAGCPEPVTVAVLDGTVGLAEQSAGRDAQAFGDAVHALRDQLPCLEAVVSPSLAARLHRVEGLQAFVDGAGERALMAFAASNRLDPDYRFPATLFPQAHPVARLWARSCDLEWGWTSAATGDAVALWVDGAHSWQRPDRLPSVAQLVRDHGVVATAYIWPQDDLPLAPPEPAPVAQLHSTGPAPGHRIQVPSQRRAHVPLGISAGLTALAGGISYALALNTASDYRTNPHSDTELEQLRQRANTLVYVSTGLGGVAVGTGVGAVIAWRR
jgi:hypothetical protein